jgi:pyruvate/2-oxoglutarate dehydrogenase complex dihydrolipoamide acyltransferase (E2) component
MATQVLVPRLGESVEEVTITKWLKKEGDPVKELEPLLEVNTDKVDTEIPSPAGGTLLKILISEGQSALVGAILAWIGIPGEELAGVPAPSSMVVEASQSQPVPVPLPASALTPPPESREELGFISPVVARIAREHGIDLHHVPRSGQGGRITKKDVLAYLDQQPASFTAQLAATQPSETSQAVPGRLIPLTPVRRLIAEHMVFSKHTSAHVTTVMEVDLSRVVSHRQQNKEDFSRNGVNLTFTAYFLASSVTALKEHPLVNSSWTEAGIHLHPEINIGVATSLGEAGLIVPVIKNADTLSLLGLARAINDLANRARLRQLKPDEVKGGTFTITNHGTSNSLFATPIINQPQCAILGVGAIQKRVVVVEDQSGSDALAIRPMVYITLTFDHRILDGALADAFLAKVVQSLTKWS